MSQTDFSNVRPVKGVVFDMDGLLLDSETLAMEALTSAATALGYDMPQTFGRRMIGLPADDCRRLVLETYGETFPLTRLFELQETHLREFVDADRLVLKKGVAPLLDWLDEHQIPRAIATSSSRYRTDHHLKLVGLFDRFDEIVTRDDVTRGKPGPEPYLTAAARIGVATEDCLALEDSPNGARAAHAAGIRVIVIPDLIQPSEDIIEKAHEIMDDLHGVLAYIQRVNAVAS